MMKLNLIFCILVLIAIIFYVNEIEARAKYADPSDVQGCGTGCCVGVDTVTCDTGKQSCNCDLCTC
uniref:Uncharacterized protein n=2 Tax=Meloidogyne TaxID=189290 RepID=A0A6V7V8V1_MELEN|nr:unnamed protein product [Meloidogyne enterolobii]CAD2170848.1 unnamed protein product [Meloidogyne enterolobii]